MKKTIKVLAAFLMWVSASCAALAVAPDSTWVGTYGMILIGSKQGIAVGDLCPVAREGRDIGMFTIERVDASFSIGRLHPSDLAIKTLLKNDNIDCDRKVVAATVKKVKPEPKEKKEKAAPKPKEKKEETAKKPEERKEAAALKPQEKKEEIAKNKESKKEEKRRAKSHRKSEDKKEAVAEQKPPAAKPQEQTVVAETPKPPVEEKKPVVVEAPKPVIEEKKPVVVETPKSPIEDTPIPVVAQRDAHVVETKTEPKKEEPRETTQAKVAPPVKEKAPAFEATIAELAPKPVTKPADELALKPLPDALSKQTNLTAKDYNRLAVDLTLDNNLDAALVWFDEAIALSPAEPLYHRNKAVALTKLGRFRQALEYANKARSLGDPKADALIALIHEFEQRTEDSKK